MDARIEIRSLLERTRSATEALLEPLRDDELTAQVTPSEPPLVWSLAHVAHFEELWVLRTAKGDPPIPDAHDEVYGALARARRERRRLPALRPVAVRAYAADVRERVLEMLEHVDLDVPDALLRRGFVFGLVIQHEAQRQESTLQTLQLRTAVEYPLPATTTPDRAPGGPAEIRVPGGTFTCGAVYEPWAYDNELMPHEVELPPFLIDRAPVSNRQFLEFVEDRGYRTRRAWSAEGWAWRTREAIDAPAYWEDGAERTRFGHREPLPLDEPVQHVSWYEADAFARWAGKRLPTEAEWERAAGWHRREGKQRYPWGQVWTGFEATLERRRFAPAPVGSYAGGVSAAGCVQMAGDVWEWTSSTFRPYPGFVAYPYPEVSEMFFGDDVRVLRGGSWATDGLLARSTFRCWDDPGRRQLFAGVRCARDA